MADNPNDTIIAADTIVWYDGKPIHSPKTEEEAYEGLKIGWQSHNVYTGITIINKDKESTFSNLLKVYMKDYNDIQIYDI